MSKFTYAHELVVSSYIAEDLSFAELTVTRHYTDASSESARVVLTPQDFDTTADMMSMMREMLVNLAEQV